MRENNKKEPKKRPVYILINNNDQFLERINNIPLISLVNILSQLYLYSNKIEANKSLHILYLLQPEPLHNTSISHNH